RQPPMLVCQIDNTALAANGKTGSGCRDLVVGTVLTELRDRLDHPKPSWYRLATYGLQLKFLALERAFYVQEVRVRTYKPTDHEITALAHCYRQQREREMGFAYWFTQLWELAVGTGFGGVYLLIDQVDDYLPRAYEPQQAMEILQHLLVPGHF